MKNNLCKMIEKKNVTAFIKNICRKLLSNDFFIDIIIPIKKYRLEVSDGS